MSPPNVMPNVPTIHESRMYLGIRDQHGAHKHQTGFEWLFSYDRLKL